MRTSETEYLLRSPRNRRRLLRALKRAKQFDYPNLRPHRAVRPGDILRGEIEARGWTQKDLAKRIDRPYQAVNEIVRGRKQITAATALALAGALGTSPEFWMNLESGYRLDLARKELRQTRRTKPAA